MTFSQLEYVRLQDNLEDDKRIARRFRVAFIALVLLSVGLWFLTGYGIYTNVNDLIRQEDSEGMTTTGALFGFMATFGAAGVWTELNKRNEQVRRRNRRIRDYLIENPRPDKEKEYL
ncbi:hypothetical protein BJD55_gp120 [Gordonia phage Yvonnetastic]|uniref:Uncharacterized protein n=1 Tax=Gordonia phage Yvonnetastic TaxID=1821566 RepID=A0A142K963_9CAUD|nr:hypothetical protein BJD55_gp120 [Gordonia phage Yvonnetastic]AMS02646.1 hypothetical protein SEA_YVONNETASTIC_102 [Gordonia phage Yvonnetastic]